MTSPQKLNEICVCVKVDHSEFRLEIMLRIPHRENFKYMPTIAV